MFKFLKIVALALIISLIPVYGDALELQTLDGDDLTILYEKPLENVVSNVTGLYPRIRADLEEKLDLKVGFKPAIILIHTDSEFSRMVRGNDLVTAFALPDRNTMVIDYSKMLKTPFDLELTLKHELSHLLLHDYIDDKNLPKWLDEGVCQWVSNGIADIIQFDGKKLLKQAVFSGRYIPLNDISTGFPNAPELFKLSYEESRDFVEYIDNRFGKEKVLDLLESLHNGDNIVDAAIVNFEVDMKTLEKDWHDHLRRKHTWFIFISNNLSWLIFAFGGLIAFIAYVKFRMRLKNYKDDDDDDDGDNELYDSREPEEVKPWEK